MNKLTTISLGATIATMGITMMVHSGITLHEIIVEKRRLVRNQAIVDTIDLMASEIKDGENGTISIDEVLEKANGKNILPSEKWDIFKIMASNLTYRSNHNVKVNTEFTELIFEYKGE